MKVRKSIIRVINEEISDYDFLGNERHMEDMEYFEFLENEEFQKQFICDYLLNKSNKFKITIAHAKIGGDWDNINDDAVNLTIDHSIDIEYKFDVNKESIKFNLLFDSNNININVKSKKDIGGEKDEKLTYSWFEYIKWDDIEVSLFSIMGDEIEFKAFNKAPKKIQEIFIKEFNKDVIVEYTKMEINGSMDYKNIVHSYC